jgi:hypothetical protein
MVFAVTVGAKNIALGHLCHNPFFAPTPSQAHRQSRVLFCRISMMKVERGGVIFATLNALQLGLVFKKPCFQSMHSLPVLIDYLSSVSLIPITMIITVILLLNLWILERHIVCLVGFKHTM